MGALWIWRQFPRQIASDLSQFHHRRIAEWHDGTMSSYEFLELVDLLPDRGAFKTASRGGELCLEDQMLRYGVNETARLRATVHIVHGGKKYEPFTFLSVAEQRAQYEDEMATADAREVFYSYADRTERYTGGAGLGDSDFDEAEDREEVTTY